MRIATIHLLIDVDTDGEAADFCSETFADMPYIVDWAHAHTVREPFAEVTAHYAQLGAYHEGDFLRSADAIAR